jgi:hypothetical protein
MCGHRTSSRREHRVRDRNVRSADSDREQTAEMLRDHAGEGRLEPDELEERLEAAYTAKTLADLDGLVADLPRQERSERHHRRAPAWPLAVSPLIAIVALIVAVSLLVGHPMLWLAFPLFFLVWRPYWGSALGARRLYHR